MSIWRSVLEDKYLPGRDIAALKTQQARSLYRQALTRAEVKHRIDETESEIHGLTLYCQTAVSLMIEKGLITKEEFTSRLKQIGELTQKKP